MSRSETMTKIAQKLKQLSRESMEQADMDKIADIIEAKDSEGPEAVLWAHTSGDIILWPNEDASENDDGAKAVARWHAGTATLAGLMSWIDELA